MPVRVFKETGKLKKNPNCKGDCLDGGTVITAADLEAGLKMYNVTLRDGDAVFLNTGWEDLFLQFPAMNAVYNASEPGINKAAAEWLTSQKVVFVGADTWAVEVIPGESASIAFPVHVHLPADNGVHIVENVRTDLIAAAAQKDGRATFFPNMTVPKAVGFTGTFIGIEAIRRPFGVPSKTLASSRQLRQRFDIRLIAVRRDAADARHLFPSARTPSSTSLPVNADATIWPVSASTPRCSFRLARRLLVPCFSTNHSPAPHNFSPVLSTSKWTGRTSAPAAVGCGGTIFRPSPLPSGRARSTFNCGHRPVSLGCGAIQG